MGDETLYGWQITGPHRKYPASPPPGTARYTTPDGGEVEVYNVTHTPEPGPFADNWPVRCVGVVLRCVRTRRDLHA